MGCLLKMILYSSYCFPLNIIVANPFHFKYLLLFKGYRGSVHPPKTKIWKFGNTGWPLNAIIRWPHVNVRHCQLDTRPRGYTAFYWCSTQLSMKFHLLIKTKMLKNKDVSCFQFLRCCIHHANANNCWHFNIHELDKFMLSRAGHEKRVSMKKVL